MNYLYKLPLLFLIFVPCLSAQTLWDGGASTDSWHDANNWSTDAVPTSAAYQNVTINVNTNLGNSGSISNWRLNINGATNAGVDNLTYDLPVLQIWDSSPGSNNDNLNFAANGSFTVTNSWSNTNTGVSIFRNVDLVMNASGSTDTVNFTINAQNNTNMRVWDTRYFGNNTGQAERIHYSGTSNAEVVHTGASRVASSIDFFVLDTGYNGTMIWESSFAGAIDPGNTFRVRDGRAEIAANNQFSSSARVVLEDFGTDNPELAFMDVTDDFDTLFIRENGGILEINDSTLTIDTYNTNPGIDWSVTNWSEGVSSIAFLDATDFPEYGGLTIGEFAALADVTIDGGTAYLFKDGATSGYFSAVPEPRTYAVALALFVLLFAQRFRRRFEK